MAKRLLLIINPVSGLRTGLLFLPRINEILCQGGYEVSIMITSKRGDAGAWSEKYGAEYDVIAAVGGDGTFNEVVSGNLRGAMKPVGYIPCGSTNDFAASMGLKNDIVAAARDIADGTVHEIDTGLFGDRTFTYVASFGAFTRASYATNQSAKNILGHLAYVLEGGAEIGSIRPENVHLRANGVDYEGDYIFGAVSNSTSLGGVLSLPEDQVDMNDGVFEMMLVRNPTSAQDLSEIIAAVTQQSFDDCRQIDFVPSGRIEVIKGPSEGWSLDGEYEKGRDGITIENRRSSLKLIY